jgi:hypothetical protein
MGSFVHKEFCPAFMHHTNHRYCNSAAVFIIQPCSKTDPHLPPLVQIMVSFLNIISTWLAYSRLLISRVLLLSLNLMIICCSLYNGCPLFSPKSFHAWLCLRSSSHKYTAQFHSGTIKHDQLQAMPMTNALLFHIYLTRPVPSLSTLFLEHKNNYKQQQQVKFQTSKKYYY